MFNVSRKMTLIRPKVLFGVMLIIALLCGSGVIIAVAIGRTPTSLALAFTSNRDGSSQIYLFDDMTHQLHPLPSHTDARLQSAWSPKDSLAYVGSAPLHVSVLDSDFSRVTLLSNQESWNNYQPDWSPTEQLAIATNRNINWDIVLYNPPETYTFAPFNTTFNELEPCWWQDGQLSFVSDRTGNSSIYKYDFVHHTTVNLTDSSSNDYNPACSSDNQLAFTSTRDLNAEIYVMNLETGDTQNVTQNPASDFNPAWLPDGRLSFVSDRDGNREIYVLDLATNQLTNVTMNPADDDQPAWTS